MPVDLRLLPEVHFAPLDATALESAIFAHYEKLSGLTLQPATPERLFLESLAYRICVENNLIDLTGRQNLLAYATGASLDHLGALMGVARIPAQPARTILRFSLGAPLDYEAPVPKGTRAASQDGRIAFATISEGAIKKGELYWDLVAFCTEAGIHASGLVPGQICRLVDPLPWIISVSNITATTEGADTESDERLRERIRLAPESFTVAGSYGEYEARALAASAEIASVSVTTPEPGVVDVRFVLAGGELPDSAMVALVQEALSAETVRPLTDHVIVGAPDPVSFAISGTWRALRSDAPVIGQITANVEKAVSEYLNWQTEKPGRDIVRERLTSLIYQAGAKRVQITDPGYLLLLPTQIARVTTVNLEFAGLEDE